MNNLVFVILIMFGTNTFGLTLNKVNIFGEDIRECGLSSDSVTASLASLMRYNRIAMDKSLNSVNLYHQVTSIDLGNSCASNINISFHTYEPSIFVPTLKKNISADAVLCNKTVLLTGPKSSMQNRVNNEAKSLAEECLLVIDKK